MDQLKAVRTALAAGSSVRPPTSKPNDTGRVVDIVIFGYHEDSDVNMWKRRVDEVQQFVAGAPAYTVDIDRVGGHSNAAEKKRPVIVRLRTVWYKWLILNHASKLKRCAKHAAMSLLTRDVKRPRVV
jgi:hypothetical protein